MKKSGLKIYQIKRKPKMLPIFFFLQLVMENIIISDSFCQIAQKYYKIYCQFQGDSRTTDSVAADLPRNRSAISLGLLIKNEICHQGQGKYYQKSVGKV